MGQKKDRNLYKETRVITGAENKENTYQNPKIYIDLYSINALKMVLKIR